MFEPIFRSPEYINSVVENFLESYCPSKTTPIQIEQIIEFQLLIDIIPIPGLKISFEKIGLDIDAFISSDFKSITVDQHIQEHVNNRYRFTLAHEIGHMLFHRYLYSQFKFNTIKEWIAAVKEIPLKEREMVEWQANEFAGRLLVPRSILPDAYQDALKEVKKIFNKSEKDLLLDMAIRLFLAPKFEVSDSVAIIRLQKEGLIK